MESQGDQNQTQAQGAQQQPTPTTQQGDRRLSEAEWRALRRTQLADSDLKDLISKVVSLESDLFKARNGQLEDGRAVITSDEMREFQAYRALGKPDALKTELEGGKAAVLERDALKRSAEVQAVAEVAKAKPAVLTERLERSNLTARVQGEGDKAAVHLFDAEGKDLGQLREYAEKNWADYVPALFPQQAQPTVTPVTGQVGAGNGQAAPTNAFTAALQGSNATPREGQTVISAFDFAPPTGGKA